MFNQVNLKTVIRKKDLIHIFKKLDNSVPILIGAIFFLIIIGYKPLNPKNIAWLQGGDPETLYLGWVFFRNQLNWSIPLGLNTDYGYGYANTILYSDSNPLLAIFFRIISPLLSETFQYFGAWLLICFILQAWFAWKIIKIVTNDFYLKTLATVFFVISPAMLWRLHPNVGHLVLSGHFIILWGLYLCLRKTRKKQALNWLFLIGISVTVNPYLFVMVFGLWMSDLWMRRSAEKIFFKYYVLEFFTLTFFSLGLMWQVGYFAFIDGLNAGNPYSLFRMNILEIFHPIRSDYGDWSLITPKININLEHHEGFNYLGFGVISIIPISIYLIIKNFNYYINIFYKYKSLLLVLFIFLILSVSNIISIGALQFYIPVNINVSKLYDVFRAHGRMFWPVYYSIYILLLFTVIANLKGRYAFIILFAALTLQMVDGQGGWNSLKSRYHKPSSSEWARVLNDPFWEVASKKYQYLMMAPPSNAPKDWDIFAAYAAKNRIKTNAVYLARVSRSRLMNAQENWQQRILNQDFDSDTLYILDESKMSANEIFHFNNNPHSKRVGRFFVIAP